MTITEALVFNKKIRRDCWGDNRYIIENDLGYFVDGHPLGSLYHLSVKEIKATNWFPFEEEKEKEKEEEFLALEMEPIMRLSIKCKFCGNVQDETFSIKKELKDYYDNN